MAETDAVIRISATGADAASAAIGSVSQSMQGIAGQSDNLKGKFQEKFQHIGLMLFAGDAIRASGLGREARMMISALNLAMQEGAAAAGLSSGGLLLVVAALGALAGIIVKVIQHHKDLTVELQKTIDANDKQLKSVDDSIAGLEHFAIATGGLTAQQKNLLGAYTAVGGEIRANQMKTYQGMLIEIEKQIAANEAHAKYLHIVHEALSLGRTIWAEATKFVKEHLVIIAILNPELALMGVAIKKVFDMITHYIGGLKLTSAETKNLTEKNDLLKLKYQEVIDSINRLGTSHAKTYEDMAKQVDEFKAYMENAEIEQAKFVEENKKKEVQEWKKAHEAEVKVAEDVSRAFGDSIGKMLIEGKSFSQAMTEAFRNMAEQIISDIIRVEMEMAILEAMGMPGGGMFGGYQAGGSVLLTRPTLMLGGEGGEPEIATFTPLSKLGSSAPSFSGVGGGGGGSTVNIGTVETNIHGVQDPDEIADQVGRKIVERVRGMGDISFARSF